MREKYESSLNELAKEISEWRMKMGFETNWENMPGKLMLVVTEVAEAMEAYRDGNINDFEMEIADTIIRLLDISGTLNLDIERTIKEKMLINEQRPYKHGRKI